VAKKTNISLQIKQNEAMKLARIAGVILHFQRMPCCSSTVAFLKPVFLKDAEAFHSTVALFLF